VTTGDLHSAVLLTNTLNPADDNTLVANYAGRRLELLRPGAATGDIGYRYKFANQLIDGARGLEPGGQRARLIDEAWPHLLAVDAAGDPRAAHLIACVMTQALSAHDAAAPSGPALASIGGNHVLSAPLQPLVP
jgi:hypothetical protein